MEIHMVENRQKGITNAYRNDKKDVDTRWNQAICCNLDITYNMAARIDTIVISKLAATICYTRFR